MALGGFLVFLERHHVDRAHGFELGAHVAVELVFGGELFAGDRSQSCVGHERGALDAQFVEAGFGHVLRVGLKLGGGGGQFAAAVASLIEQQAAVAQEFVDFGEAGAKLFGFELQQAFAGLRGVALGFEVGGVLRELLVFGFALQLFGGGGFDLRGQRVDALAHLGEQRLDALQDGGGRAVALFERGHAGGMLRSRLRRFFAALAQSGQRFLRGGDLLFELDALQFQDFDFGLAGADDAFLLGALGGQALQFELRRR